MKVEITKIHHFTFTPPTGGEKKASWFYGEILGLKEMELPEVLTSIYKIRWFYLLDMVLHIEFSSQFVRPEEQQENGVIMPGNHIALEVKNIKEIKSYLEKNKIEIREAVTVPDRDRFYVIDPFGNCIELIEFHKS